MKSAGSRHRIRVARAGTHSKLLLRQLVRAQTRVLYTIQRARVEMLLRNTDVGAHVSKVSRLDLIGLVASHTGVVA